MLMNMKITINIVCCILGIALQDTVAASRKKQLTKIETETEESSASLHDVLQRKLQSYEDLSVSTIRKPVLKNNKIKLKNQKNDTSEETSNEEAVENRIMESDEEDETVEDGRTRKAAPNRRFDDVYRYENNPLKNMLVWLSMNAKNAELKDSLTASRSFIDKYVKHTVDKAGNQAALRSTDYTSLRFDKDKIVLFCGGQVYTYYTLQDSKICFNGNVYETRLI